MDIKKILEYQKKDMEAVALERKLDENEDKKIYTSMIGVVKDAQNRSASLEKNAEDIVHDYNNLKKTYEENVKMLENLSQKDTEKLDEKALADIKEVSNKILSNLNVLEKKIISQADAVKKILDEFESTKKRYISAKAKHSEHKQKYEETYSRVEPELKRIEKELSALEHGIDPVLLAKYKAKRTDKFFPIFVPIRGNACGGCMMELPTAVIEKVKKEGVLECENCRRIMYSDAE